LPPLTSGHPCPSLSLPAGKAADCPLAGLPAALPGVSGGDVTVQLLEDLSRRAADLAGALPSLDLSPAELTRLAGEVERIWGRLASVEERVAALGPA